MSNFENIIIDTLPEGIRPSGVEKLSKITLDKAISLQTILNPRLNSLLEELGVQQGIIPDQCPTQEVLDKVLQSREDILRVLVTFNNTVKTLSETLTGTSRVIQILIQILRIVKTSRIAINLLNKTLPVVPGAAAAIVQDLNEVQDTVTFTELGDAKLKKLKETIDKARIPLSIVTKILGVILNNLEVVDTILKKCSPSTSIEPIPAFLNELKSLSDESENTSTPTSLYNNYLIKIETIPYSSTVNQNKAVAFNSEGIPVLEIGLSFTTRPDLLIEELKIRIDSEL